MEETESQGGAIPEDPIGEGVSWSVVGRSKTDANMDAPKKQQPSSRRHQSADGTDPGLELAASSSSRSGLTVELSLPRIVSATKELQSAPSPGGLSAASPGGGRFAPPFGARFEGRGGDVVRRSREGRSSSSSMERVYEEEEMAEEEKEPAALEGSTSPAVSSPGTGSVVSSAGGSSCHVALGEGNVAHAPRVASTSLPVSSPDSEARLRLRVAVEGRRDLESIARGSSKFAPTPRENPREGPAPWTK